MLETVFVIVMTYFVVFVALFFTSILIYSFNAILEKITNYSIADIVYNILQSITISIMTIKRKRRN